MEIEPISTDPDVNECIVYRNLNNHLKMEQQFFDQLTEEQKISAARTIVRQGYGVKSAIVYDYMDGCLCIQFSHIMIGIEKDGYAHS